MSWLEAIRNERGLSQRSVAEAAEILLYQLKIKKNESKEGNAK